jgi:amino acid transporter
MASGLLKRACAARSRGETRLQIGGVFGGKMAGSPSDEPKMKPTLGLTGVTVNAMALIAPGAFLWITFVIQAGYVYPSAMAMWAGIFFAIMLAYATAISYAELSKL